MNIFAKRTVVIALSASIVLPGCNTSGGLASRFGGGAPNDACVAERKPLIDTESAFENTVLTGALIGAIGGAALGVMVGNGRAAGALAGAAIGAAAGGGLGYLEGKRQQAATSGEILALVNKDTRADQTSLSAAARAIPALQKCRLRQIEDLNRALSAKQIDRDAARARLKEITDAVEQDNALINSVLEKSDERTNQYIRAVAVENKLNVEVAEAAQSRVLKDKAQKGNGLAYLKGPSELRAGASKTADFIASLDGGTAVAVLEKSGSWRQVDAGGKTGFVQANQLSSTPPKAKIMTAQSSLSSSSGNAFVSQVDLKASSLSARNDADKGNQAIRDAVALLASTHHIDVAPSATPTASAKL